MKLGSNLEISLSVTDLDTNLEFFRKLGLRQTAGPHTDPYPWTVLTDGFVHLGLHQTEMATPALVYFTNDLAARLEFLAENQIALLSTMEQDERVIMAWFKDPNGQRLAVADLMGAEIPSPEGLVLSGLGHFGEFSIPTRDLAASVEFYRQFDFEQIGGDVREPYPWAILFDGLVPIGLHQTDEFDETTITYFARNMGERIAALQSKGIEMTWTHENDAGEPIRAQLGSPDGQAIFLFAGEGEAYGG